jgi:hypothetical protein
MPGQAKAQEISANIAPSGAVADEQIPLMTVMSSSVATSADRGKVALVLRTEEAGPIGFQVTIEACAVLRCQIAIAEASLRNTKRSKA